uniref:Uncharacterized protein n=1 Tax=Panagrolaimus superbus TaxID=310955 RepID=A0A914YQA7_9BILA
MNNRIKSFLTKPGKIYIGFIKSESSITHSCETIPYYFIPKSEWIASCILAAAKIPATENLLIVKLAHGNERVEVEELCYSNLGYTNFDHGFFNLSRNSTPASVKAKILRNTTSKNIVVIKRFQNDRRLNILNAALTSMNPLIIDFDDIEKATPEVASGLTKWLIEKSETQMFIIPKCVTRSGIFAKNDSRIKSKPMVFPSFREEMFSMGLKFDDFDAEVTAAKEMLPFKKSFIVAKPFLMDYFFKYIDTSKFEWVCFSAKKEYTFDITLKKKECHQNEIILSIDYNNFPSYKIKPIIIDAVKDLPETMKMFSTKIPIIAFFDQSSVICIHNNNENGYDFIEQWNGMLGKELFISFTQEKPKFGENAWKDYEKNSSFVVYDFIKIMTQPSDGIIFDEKWKFKITKNEENSNLFEFDNFDGTVKAASPAFLMAMALKEHRKVIKKVIGEMPKEFGFILLDDFQDFDAKKRVKNGIKEACALLKIESCFFDV